MEGTCDKPPIGLRPRWIVQSLRIREILEAIDRYVSAGKPIPKEWSDELNELFAAQRETEERKRKVDLGCRRTEGELTLPEI